MPRPDAWLCTTTDGKQRVAVVTAEERNLFALAGRVIEPLYLPSRLPQPAAADAHKEDSQ